MNKFICRDVSKRITAKQALEHQWIQQFNTQGRSRFEDTLEKSKQQGMLGKVSSHLKGNVLDKLDKNELEALMNEFENWSNGKNPMLRKMTFM